LLCFEQSQLSFLYYRAERRAQCSSVDFQLSLDNLILGDLNDRYHETIQYFFFFFQRTREEPDSFICVAYLDMIPSHSTRDNAKLRLLFITTVNELRGLGFASLLLSFLRDAVRASRSVQASFFSKQMHLLFQTHIVVFVNCLGQLMICGVETDFWDHHPCFVRAPPCNISNSYFTNTILYKEKVYQSPRFGGGFLVHSKSD
jgi:hypothetical protein